MKIPKKWQIPLMKTLYQNLYLSTIPLQLANWNQLQWEVAKTTHGRLFESWYRYSCRKAQLSLCLRGQKTCIFIKADPFKQTHIKNEYLWPKIDESRLRTFFLRFIAVSRPWKNDNVFSRRANSCLYKILNIWYVCPSFCLSAYFLVVKFFKFFFFLTKR